MAEPEPVPEPEPEPEYRRVALRASLVPRLAHPSGSGSDVVSSYSLNFVGYQAGLDGIEVGFLLNMESDFVHGVQASLGGNIVGGKLRGAQFGLGLNWAGSVNGVQVAPGINVSTGALDGVQASMLNVAADVSGLQVGILNIGGEVDGLQLGLVNVASASDVSLGLVNINYDRPLYVTTWASELGMMHVGLQHGSRYVQWIVSGGVAPIGEGLASAGVGLGGHVPLGWAYLELDAMVHAVGSLEAHSGGLLNQARLTIGVPIGERFAVYGGVSANVLVTEPIDDTGRVLSFDDTGFATRVDSGGTADVWVWPGFFAGMRF